MSVSADNLEQVSTKYTSKRVKLQAQINHELEQLQASVRLLVDADVQTFMASVATPQFYAASNKVQRSKQIKQRYNGHCECPAGNIQ